MKRIIVWFFLLFSSAAFADGLIVPAPCSAFGTTSGTCLQGAGALGSPSSIGTLPAYTLGGTISGGGNQINNVIIGSSTPLTGAFTTLSTTSTINGATLDNTAWATYTSTFSATTGTATVVAKRKTIGKLTAVDIDVTFTSTITGTFSVTLPTNDVNATGFTVVLANLGGALGLTNSNAGGSTLNVLKFDGTQFLISGSHILISGTYENP